MLVLSFYQINFVKWKSFYVLDVLRKSNHCLAAWERLHEVVNGLLQSMSLNLY